MKYSSSGGRSSPETRWSHMSLFVLRVFRLICANYLFMLIHISGRIQPLWRAGSGILEFLTHSATQMNQQTFVLINHENQIERSQMKMHSACTTQLVFFELGLGNDDSWHCMFTPFLQQQSTSVTSSSSWTAACKSRWSISWLIDSDSLIWLMAPHHSLWWMDVRALDTGTTCACWLRYSMIM